jgi:glycosyltransferase involved in cell wall biosynthesis
MPTHSRGHGTRRRPRGPEKGGRLMKIIAIACVRDEIDIIEAFVRHNLAHVERLIVLDNGSSDGTRDVLEALRKEGLPLDILSDPSPGKQLSRRMTMLMRDIAVGRHGADWVLPLDADEFVTVAWDEPLVPEGASGDQPLHLTWLTYMPDADDDQAELNPVVRIRHRLMDEPAQRILKVFVPRSLAASSSAVLAQGSHELSVDGRVCPSVLHERACLAHFPVRSRGQFIAKTVIGHLQNLVMAFRDPRAGVHHRTYFELLQHDDGAFSGDFASWLRRHGVYRFYSASTFSADPLAYRGGPLRYTPRLDEVAQSWKSFMHYGRDLAQRYGLLKASLTEDQCVSVEQQLDIFTYLRQQLDQREQQVLQQQSQVAHAQHLFHVADLRVLALQQQCQELQAAESRAMAQAQPQQEQIQKIQVQLEVLTDHLQATALCVQAAETRGQAAELQIALGQQLQQMHKTQVQLHKVIDHLQTNEAQLRMETQRLDREFRRSWTWRVGRWALWPARLLRRGWRQCRWNPTYTRFL